jgi:hypothetical protein
VEKEAVNEGKLGRNLDLNAIPRIVSKKTIALQKCPWRKAMTEFANFELLEIEELENKIAPDSTSIPLD